MMKVLGIETSCDETSAAVVEDGRLVLSNIVASQVEIHARYGGIVPEVASRQHLLSAVPVLSQALAAASVTWEDLSGVAVTRGPGLAGSLIVGVNLAKSLAFARGLPLIGVNHLEGHIYAAWLLDRGEEKEPPEFPLLCLVVSGAHSDLVLMRSHGQYVRLGRTLDDAAGEAFDKVARVLHLGYPGGPVIQRRAQGATATYPLPRAWLRGTADFSFSGLKTAVLRLVEGLDVFAQERSDEEKEALVSQVASSFQEAVVDVLVTKTVAVAQQHRVRQIVLAGGVAANAVLRQTLTERSPIPVVTPRPILCTDNAAMIAAAGYFRLVGGERSGWDLDVYPGLKLGVGG